MSLPPLSPARLQLLPYFPVLRKLGVALEKRVTELAEDKEDAVRPDIKLMAMSFLGKLRTSKTTWITEVRVQVSEAGGGSAFGPTSINLTLC
jgi:hypothetical protein